MNAKQNTAIHPTSKDVGFLAKHIVTEHPQAARNPRKHQRRLHRIWNILLDKLPKCHHRRFFRSRRRGRIHHNHHILLSARPPAQAH